MDADKAIDRLINLPDLRIVQEWRGKHLSPMVKLKDFVMEKMQESQIDCEFVSARLKMITTILDKVKTGRHKKVSTMQDLGGVRVVFHNQEDLYKLHTILLECKTFKIVRTKDYIKETKETGYRGIHIIYNVDGYSIELQLRTIGQHIWASTVETVGWYLNEDLKSGVSDLVGALLYFQELSIVFNNNNPILEEIDKMPDLIEIVFDDIQHENITDMDGEEDDYITYMLYQEEAKLLTEVERLYDKYHRKYQGNYFCLHGLRVGGKNTHHENWSPFFIRDIMNSKSSNNVLALNELYDELEKDYHNDSDRRKVLFIWLSDPSKLEDAYPCFFSQTKQFTDYLENIKAE